MGNISSKRNEQLNTTPTTLYNHCSWDPKVVRRLILERKLAPISVGREETSDSGLEECPICFLYYSGGLNRSKCCRKGACTECYLQVKRPNQNTTCPFCNHAQYIVTFSGPLSREEIAQEVQEQQKVQELKTLMRNEEIERDNQRKQEKERLRLEKELLQPNNPVATLSSAPLSTVSAQHTKASTNSVPIPHHPVSSNTHLSPFGHHNTTYLTSNTTQASFADSSFAEADLDDLMLMEAIRLSLLDVQSPPPSLPLPSPSPPSSLLSSSPLPSTVSIRTNTPIFWGSSDKNNYTDDFSHSITTSSTTSTNTTNPTNFTYSPSISVTTNTTTHSLDHTKSTDLTDFTNPTNSINTTNYVDSSTNSTNSATFIEFNNSTNPTDPTNSTDPKDPTNSTDLTDPTSSTNILNPTVSTGINSTDLTNSTKSTNLTNSVNFDNFTESASFINSNIHSTDSTAPVHAINSSNAQDSTNPSDTNSLL